MKPSDDFKKAIDKHLKQRAEQDPLFAVTLKKENKNIDDCVTYILNQVQKSGCNGFTDDEIYGMAAHYYDEDDVKPGNKISMKVVVNHQVELSADEIAKAKEQAREQLIAEERNRLQKKSTAKPEPATVKQASLF